MGKALTLKTTGIYKKVDGKMQEVQIEVDEAKKLYKEDFLSVYPKFFFNKMAKLKGWQSEVGSKIQKEWEVQSAIDFGCASGFYLFGMFNNGAKVKGFEYAFENSKHLVPEEIKEMIHYGNAQENLVDGIYELSMSIEVAEHVLPEKSDIFVNNLTESSSKYIVFSAAGLGEKGTGHINCRPFEEWVEMFDKNGFEPSKEDTKTLRNIFKGLKKPSKYSNVLSKKVHFFRSKS